MQKNTATILGIVSAVFGLLLYVTSVAGVFFPATPPTDPGMLWTSVVFILFGVFGFLLGKEQGKTA